MNLPICEGELCCAPISEAQAASLRGGHELQARASGGLRESQRISENRWEESDGLNELDKSDGGSVVLRKRASLRGGRHELQARASGGDLENLGESLGEIRRVGRVRQVRRVGWRECCFEKFRLLMMIGLITENCKGSVELLYKK